MMIMFGGILTLLKEIKVGKIIISKQKEISENFKEFLKIVKLKKLKVEIVKQGERIIFENNVYADILWPTEELEINEKPLNNNSVVIKFYYKKFSVLFTGDIEGIAEKQIIEKYKNNKLKSTVLKVAHHRIKNINIRRISEISIT